MIKFLQYHKLMSSLWCMMMYKSKLYLKANNSSLTIQKRAIVCKSGMMAASVAEGNDQRWKGHKFEVNSLFKRNMEICVGSPTHHSLTLPKEPLGILLESCLYVVSIPLTISLLHHLQLLLLYDNFRYSFISILHGCFDTCSLKKNARVKIIMIIIMMMMLIMITIKKTIIIIII